MIVDVISETPMWDDVGLEALAEHALKATALHLGLGAECEVAILGCDDTRIAALNADFRDKPTPTNVLSWPSEDRDPNTLPPPDAELGDIAIAYQTCVTEAASQNKALSDHTSHLLVHGLLHLLGYDHETEQDAALMEGVETEILATLGIADPY